jgi:stage II sporulation protein D
MPCRAQTFGGTTVRVCLCRYFSQAASVTIWSDSALAAGTPDQPRAVQWDPNAHVTVTSALGGLQVGVPTASQDSEESQEGGAPVAATMTFSSARQNGIVRISCDGGITSHGYRGVLQVWSQGDRVLLVNSLPMEQYLYGVVGPEIGADAPDEALKAQAVAARTYAEGNVGRLVVKHADFDDTNRSQDYEGVDGERPNVSRAVDATAGVVMTWHGAIIDAEYCTDCGGMTGEGPEGEGYLQPVKDDTCADEPGWSVDLNSADICRLLKLPSPHLNEIAVLKRDRSGRAMQISVDVGGTDQDYTGSTFRALLGSDKLKSTLFQVSEAADSGTWHFTGKGWGHGLGMCQHGAVKLAQTSGWTYDQILKHYYTGIALANSRQSASAISVDLRPN